MSAYVTADGATLWAGALFGLQAIPASYYIALCTDEPGAATDGTVLAAIEPGAGSGYARQVVANPAGWTQAGNTIALAAAIDFPAPISNWGVIRYWALCTALSGGQVLAFSNFLNPLELPPGYPVSLPAGALTLGFDQVQSPVVPL